MHVLVQMILVFIIFPCENYYVSS